MRACLLAILIVAGTGARAELAQVLGFEQSLEQRIYRQVQTVDPNAQILVKVKLKEVKVNLPGVTFDFFGASGVNEIRTEDIEALEIKIISALSPFPQWLLTDIETRYTFGKIKPKVAVSQFEPETLKVIRERDPISQTVDRILRSVRESLPWILASLGVLVALFMTGFALLVSWMVRTWRTLTGRLISGLEERGGGGADARRESTETASQGHAQAQAEGVDLPVESLLELLADCYWTKADQYGRWLWDQLNSSQRQGLLEAWPSMAEYVNFLRAQVPVAGDDHNHPYYLRPLKLKDCDQKDLADFVQKEKGVWQLLSPLRQAGLELPIKTKAQLAAVKASSQTTGPKVHSKPRVLDKLVEWGALSADDERLLFADPSFIPQVLWPGISTMVWVAKLPEEMRRSLLNGYSAAEVAQCWVGPEEVLAKLREAIPEKKWRIAEGYIATVKASRHSPAFQRLSREAATLLTSQTRVADVPKAA
jgi:hypothetical protein